jgi:hypothetical protein
VWSVQRCYKQGTKLELSSVRESAKRTSARVAEESPSLEAVAREPLVKTQRAGNGLAGDL